MSHQINITWAELNKGINIMNQGSLQAIWSINTTKELTVLFHLFFLILFYLNFFIVVQVQLFPFSCHHFPRHHPHPLPTLNLSPLWLCPWVLYTCSLMTLSFFPAVIPFHFSSGDCQFVLYVNVSGSILLAYLFCWLGSTYRWDRMVFVFH